MNCSWSKVENIKLGKFGFLRVHQVAAFVCSVTQLDTSEARMLRSRKLSKYISDALISRNWANSVWGNWKNWKQKCQCLLKYFQQNICLKTRHDAFYCVVLEEYYLPHLWVSFCGVIEGRKKFVQPNSRESKSCCWKWTSWDTILWNFPDRSELTFPTSFEDIQLFDVWDRSIQ